MLEIIDYDREKAAEYAYKWAYFRNPQYYDFQNIGGDCTNFASQAIFAGAGYMNYTPTYGWYYISANDRAPSWTGVQYLYNFLTTNKGVGPYGREVPIDQLEPGDIIQLAIDKNDYHHSPVVIGIDGTPSPDRILLAAHSANANCRPLSSYYYRKIRAIHIEGVRRQI
ncbi:MAG: amidase domain-containing protein [Clostridia bacterium]|nr:amidase domain-containing protein [Clostridia bacterium]MBR4955432.1 amidase domain-containing protein [Clostridia bacterium]MBR5903106.1 amidase domain-containing protein [Clostridia bacterium]